MRDHDTRCAGTSHLRVNVKIGRAIDPILAIAMLIGFIVVACAIVRLLDVPIRALDALIGGPPWGMLAISITSACTIPLLALVAMGIDTLKQALRRIDLISVAPLLKLILPSSAQERLFDPAYHDLLKDYAINRKSKSKYLGLGFAIHVVLIVLKCFKEIAAGGALELVAPLIPNIVRDWWWRFRL